MSVGIPHPILSQESRYPGMFLVPRMVDQRGGISSACCPNTIDVELENDLSTDGSAQIPGMCW